MRLCVTGRIVRLTRESEMFQLLTLIDCITVCNMYASVPEGTGKN